MIFVKYALIFPDKVSMKTLKCQVSVKFVGKYVQMADSEGLLSLT